MMGTVMDWRAHVLPQGAAALQGPTGIAMWECVSSMAKTSSFSKEIRNQDFI